MENVREHEKDLVRYMYDSLKDIKDINIYGPENCNDRGGLISFNLQDIHPHDCATILNDFGVAIRIRSSLCASTNGKVRYCCFISG